MQKRTASTAKGFYAVRILARQLPTNGEIEIAHSLSNGVGLGTASQHLRSVDGQMIFVADAHRDDGKHFAVHADEKLNRIHGA